MQSREYTVDPRKIYTRELEERRKDDHAFNVTIAWIESGVQSALASNRLVLMYANDAALVSAFDAALPIALRRQQVSAVVHPKTVDYSRGHLQCELRVIPWDGTVQ